MKESFELYKHIVKDAGMSTYTLSLLLEQLKEKDNKIKGTVEEILKGYERYLEESKTYLEKHGESIPHESKMAKMGAGMGIKKEVKNDNSDASMADMLIKGISMGTIDMTKKINDYKDKTTKKELKFAEDFLKFQQDVITNLKKYL